MKRFSPSPLFLASFALLALAGCLLFGFSGTGIPNLYTDQGQAIMSIRLHRVFKGFVVGAGLACAGVVFQALLRNPLAEPYVLGVSSGAGLGAAIAILTGISLHHVFTLPASAAIMGAITLFLVFKLAGGNGSPSVYSLILSGVIVSSICSSILMCMIAMAPEDRGMHSIIWWMLGDLQPLSTPLIIISAGFVAVCTAGMWLISPELNAMTLGREAAHNLGIRTRMALVLGLGLATGATAAAVGMAGLIGFVGLIVPHFMRMIVGPDNRRLIPAAAIAGGVFLAACDAVARSLLTQELPVGVITALCGGPFFLVILRKKQKAGWIE